MWGVSRIHNIKKRGLDGEMEGETKRDEGYKVERVDTTSRVVRSHKHKPAEIHAHAV
jgi:hypothetical protein